MITFSLLSCGELTEQDCLDALGESDSFIKNQIRNIYPASQALNMMIQKCETSHLVPLDSDMILYPGFLDRINNAINLFAHFNYHSILFSLWDTLTQEKIMALKVFNTSVVKKIPYKDLPCPDIQHYKDLTEAGYHPINLIHEQPIGDHVVKGPFFCYSKYRDLYKTTRSYPEIILESHFKGGNDLFSRANAHFEFFCKRYEETYNLDYIYCIAGMVDGLTTKLDFKSKDLSQSEMKIPVKDAQKLFKSLINKKIIL